MDDSRLKNYTINTDKTQLDIDFIHDFLCNQSHWAHGIPRQTVETSIKHSLCFGVYHLADNKQVGFGRVITDYATFGYWADIFVIPEHRGFGLARLLIRTIYEDPTLASLRKLTLYTSKAHNFYRDIGFDSVENPENWLEIHRTHIYSHAS